MARPREVSDLDCNSPFAAAAAKVVAVRGAEVIEQSHDVLDLEDIERVHAMRVATRRLRAAMEIFASCFPRKQLKGALEEVKAIADALGERRDRDVAIAALRDFVEQVDAEERAGVEALIEALEEEQRSANERLAPFISPDRLEALRLRLVELAQAAWPAAEAEVAA